MNDRIGVRAPHKHKHLKTVISKARFVYAAGWVLYFVCVHVFGLIMCTCVVGKLLFLVCCSISGLGGKIKQRAEDERTLT